MVEKSQPGKKTHLYANAAANAAEKDDPHWNRGVLPHERPKAGPGFFDTLITSNFKHESMTKPNHRNSKLSSLLLYTEVLVSLGLIAGTMYSESNVSLPC